MNKLHRTLWIHCTCLIMSERNQTEKKTYCLIPVILSLKTSKTDLWSWKSAWWLPWWGVLTGRELESFRVVESFYSIFDPGGNYTGVYMVKLH